VIEMVRTEWLRGVFPAIITPYDERDRIDRDVFAELVDRLWNDVDGFVPCGTTGEFIYMSEREKRDLIDITVDLADGKKPVIAGTGCPSTRETLELTQYAKDAGAKAALVASPFYFKPSFNEVFEHFERLNELDLPLIMYNIPQCTGVHKKWWTAEGIAMLDNVIGIKDSSGDFPFLMAMFEKVKDRISIMCGHDEIAMPALAAGADGLILASANLIPDIWQRIRKSVAEGELETARELQVNIQKLVRIVVRCGANQAVKEGLGMMGMKVGNSRRPIMPGGVFKREDREELRIQLENLGKIPRSSVKFELGDGSSISSNYPKIPATPAVIGDLAMKIGEGFAGPPVYEVAHIDLLLGERGGPVSYAIEKVLKRRKDRENEPCRIIMDLPRTLLVPTVTVRTERQAGYIYNDAREGVVLAMEKSIRDGILPEKLLDRLDVIANVFVHPAARNRQRIKFNNYKAMLHAIKKALEGRPRIEEILNEKESARHPFRYDP